MSGVTVELELPQDWKRFQMPDALKTRLNSLVDEQVKTGKLSKTEREEAQALTELVDLLSLMNLLAATSDEPPDPHSTDATGTHILPDKQAEWLLRAITQTIGGARGDIIRPSGRNKSGINQISLNSTLLRSPGWPHRS